MSGDWRYAARWSIGMRPLAGWTDVHLFRGRRWSADGGLEAALERFEVERGGATCLRRDHRFEHPVAQRQPDPKRPPQTRRAVIERDDGVDLDGDPFPVLAAEPECSAWLEDRDAAVKHGRPAGDGLADPKPGTRAERPGLGSFDADDAGRDQPCRIPLDVDQCREDVRGWAGDRGLDVDGDRHRSASAGSTGRSRNDGPCPRLSAGVP